MIALVAGAVACGGATDKAGLTTKPVMTDKSLYERLGGLEAIRAVVDDFVANVAADPAINARFANTELPQFKEKLVEQICATTGGPCTYGGKDMVTAHTGMNISNEEFDALMGDLEKTLDKLSVPQREQDELLAALGGMRGEIVQK